jgi:hypothetical protein
VEDGDDFVRWLPFLGTEHTQAHRAFVIVADVRVVDFGFEAYYWRFKRIFSRKCQSKLEVAALSGVYGQQRPGRVWGLGALHSRRKATVRDHPSGSPIQSYFVHRS